MSRLPQKYCRKAPAPRPGTAMGGVHALDIAGARQRWRQGIAGGYWCGLADAGRAEAVAVLAAADDGSGGLLVVGKGEFCLVPEEFLAGEAGGFDA